MANINSDSSDISVMDVCKNINDEIGKLITAEILNLFKDNGMTYKIKDDGSREVSPYLMQRGGYTDVAAVVKHMDVR